MTADEIKDPHHLQIRLWVNGTLMQNFNTSDMAHKIPRCIEWVSSIHAIEPGDILATGTNHRGLSAFQDGDVIEIEAGQAIPADARLLVASELRVNEAPLTGESFPVDKVADARLTGDDQDLRLPLADAVERGRLDRRAQAHELEAQLRLLLECLAQVVVEME